MFVHVLYTYATNSKRLFRYEKVHSWSFGIVIATFFEHLLCPLNSLYMQHLILVTIQIDRHSYSTFTDKKIEA